MCESWRQFQSSLPLLEGLHIPRLITDCQSTRYELHGFCDASSLGYAAMVYVRCLLPNGTSFIMAKSKVAPLKVLFIPRFELCAAVLLSNIVGFVGTTLDSELRRDQIFA